MTASTTDWSAGHRVAFRFAFVLLGLLALHLFSVDLVFAHVPGNPWWAAWSALVGFLSPRLLGVTATGSVQASDALAAWLQLAWSGIFAAVAAAVWSAVARARSYPRLHDGLRTLVRYAVAGTLFAYGVAKVLKVQFFFPSPADLVQTYAGSTPFALAWRFMGYSTPYTVFGGVLEVTGAVLLVWRRTTTLGALVLAGVMTNVVMLNLSYDIPVKNFACILLALSLFLLLPDAGRLLDLLLRHRPTTPPPLRPFPLPPRLERTRIALKAIYCLALGGALLVVQVQRWRQRGDDAPKPALWGLYDVEGFRRDGADVPLLFTDARLWQQVAFGRNWGPSLTIVTADGERHVYGIVPDEARGTIALSGDDGGTQQLAVRRVDATHLALSGRYDGQQLEVRLRWHDLARAPLLTRRSHWIDDTGGVYR